MTLCRTSFLYLENRTNSLVSSKMSQARLLPFLLVLSIKTSIIVSSVITHEELYHQLNKQGRCMPFFIHCEGVCVWAWEAIKCFVLSIVSLIFMETRVPWNKTNRKENNKNQWAILRENDATLMLIRHFRLFIRDNILSLFFLFFCFSKKFTIPLIACVKAALIDERKSQSSCLIGLVCM